MRFFLKLAGFAVLGILCGAGATLVFRGAIASYPAASGIASALPGPPQRLIIPSIGVDAPVLAVGVAKNGDLGVPPDATHVAWYKNGPEPGAPGAAVIDGHLDTIHEPQAVFYNLGKLKPGDEVDVVASSGRTFAFRVTAVTAIAYDATTTAVFTSSGGAPELNLITCTGDWMPSMHLYNERLVVFTKLE
ncbi:MAG: class F sortase [Patescibacteria group bacterium]|nr:class F sortase [Patescibacteria group bacterium]